MDKAPEKLWMTAEEMGWPGSFRSFRMSDLEHPEDEYPAYVRADLYEQVKRERDELALAFNSSCEIRERLASRTEAAERLAGARMVTDAMVEAALKSLHSNPVSWEHPETIRAALTDALAEPAGEAGPRQFLPTEDGEFNGNTTETPIAAEDRREVDWVDVTGWGVFKGHAIPVDVARYIATKINLYAQHRTTPPEASAIREALDEALDLLGGCLSDKARISEINHKQRVSDFIARSRAALAGAKP